MAWPASCARCVPVAPRYKYSVTSPCICTTLLIPWNITHILHILMATFHIQTKMHLGRQKADTDCESYFIVSDSKNDNKINSEKVLFKLKLPTYFQNQRLQHFLLNWSAFLYQRVNVGTAVWFGFCLSELSALLPLFWVTLLNLFPGTLRWREFCLTQTIHFKRYSQKCLITD